MESWYDKAWCRNNLLPEDAVELYFQETKDWQFFNALVQNTCVHCEVRVECLAHGIKSDPGSNNDQTGIFGGLAVRHRRIVRGTENTCVCHHEWSRCFVHNEAPYTKSAAKAETLLSIALLRKRMNLATETLTLTKRNRKIIAGPDNKIATLIFNPASPPVEVTVTDPNGDVTHVVLGTGAVITSFGKASVKPTSVPTVLRITPVDVLTKKERKASERSN